jgi:hypothetical protein
MRLLNEPRFLLFSYDREDRGAQPPHQADYACKHHQHRAERDGGNRALKRGGRHMSFFLSRLNGRFFVIYRPAR